MKHRPPRRNAPDVLGQLQIDWSAAPLPATVERVDDVAAAPERDPALVQYLTWDFRTSFPQPTQEALDAGILLDEDAEPENVKALHDEHAREALAALRSIDTVLDARRRGVDPKTGRPPASKEDKQGLPEFLQYELGRCERWWQTLMDTYEEVFGPEATDAFGKAIRARHAGVTVIAEAERSTVPIETTAVQGKSASTEKTPTVTTSEPAATVAPKVRRQRQSTRAVARLPVPRPLPEAVTQGRFGLDENQRPINPSADEVRDITQNHAEKLIALIAAMPYCEGSDDRPDAKRMRAEFRSDEAMK